MKNDRTPGRGSSDQAPGRSSAQQESEWGRRVTGSGEREVSRERAGHMRSCKRVYILF